MRAALGHQRAWTVKAELWDPNLKRFSFEKKAKMVKDVQDSIAAFFSLVFCDFAPISTEHCVELWNLATGFDHTVESYTQAGERIWNLIRLFNLREGVEPVDTLPERFFKEAFTKGHAKDVFIEKKDFEKSLKEYYGLRGWDEAGIPKLKKLAELGLSEYSKVIV